METIPLTGHEHFTFKGHNTDLTILCFWQWAYSDLLNNTSRGIMAEFLVYAAVNKIIPPPGTQMRNDWLPFDVTSPSGRRIEVKSAAYVQSWDDEYHEHITYDIAPKFAWTPEDGMAAVKKRNSDLYVFCLWKAVSKNQSILDLDLWEFYVLPTSVLDARKPNQKTIGLESLKKLEPIVTDYFGLKDAIETLDLQRT